MLQECDCLSNFGGHILVLSVRDCVLYLHVHLVEWETEIIFHALANTLITKDSAGSCQNFLYICERAAFVCGTQCCISMCITVQIKVYFVHSPETK